MAEGRRVEDGREVPLQVADMVLVRLDDRRSRERRQALRRAAARRDRGQDENKTPVRTKGAVACALSDACSLTPRLLEESLPTRLLERIDRLHGVIELSGRQLHRAWFVWSPGKDV